MPDETQPEPDEAAPTEGFPLPAYDVISVNPPAPKRRLGLLVGIGAVILATVATAGIYAAAQLSGGGTQPEELVPATAFAFAKIDLDPAANQKIAVNELANHFPDAPKGTADDVLQRFVREAFKEVDEVDYDADIKPWLDKRVGLAGFVDAAGKAHPLGVVQSKDDAKARVAMDKLVAGEQDVAYTIDRGYVLISDTQAAADEAKTESAKASLDGNDTYQADVDLLDGDQILVGWADVKRSFDVFTKEAGDLTPLDLSKLPSFITDRITGRFVAGLHAEKGYLELAGRSIGGDLSKVKTGGLDLFSRLPAGTVAAVGAYGLDETLGEAFYQFAASDLIPGFAAGLADIEKEIGISIRDEIIPLLGSETAVQLGDVPDLESAPEVGFISTVRDPAKVRATAVKLARIARDTGFPVVSRLDGNTFYLALEQSHLDQLKATGGLTSDPTFKTAMGDLGDRLGAAFYADLGRLLTLAKDTDLYDNLRPLSAVGLVSGIDGDQAFFRLRVVVR